MMEFPERFERIIEFAGSAYKLSKAIGTSQSVISNIRKGKTKPSFDLLSRILLNYELIDLNWLINGSGEMFKDSSKIKLNKEPSKLNNDQEALKIQLDYAQKIIKAKERVIELLEESLDLKKEKVNILISENENLKNLLKGYEVKKDYVAQVE